jgi:hypothetical protein
MSGAPTDSIGGRRSSADLGSGVVAAYTFLHRWRAQRWPHAARCGGTISATHLRWRLRARPYERCRTRAVVGARWRPVMSGPMERSTDAREFRRRLDEVLRKRSPQATRDFLIAAGQWQEGNIPADLDRAMWMMIAASPALADLRGEAERWLVAHGYEQEARAILGRGGAAEPQRQQGGNPRRGGDPASGGPRNRAGGDSHGAPHRPARGGGKIGSKTAGGPPRSARNGHQQGGRRPGDGGGAGPRREK